MYLKATILTILGWFIGMVLDANIDFGDPMASSVCASCCPSLPWDCASCMS